MVYSCCYSSNKKEEEETITKKLQSNANKSCDIMSGNGIIQKTKTTINK